MPDQEPPHQANAPGEAKCVSSSESWGVSVTDLYSAPGVVVCQELSLIVTVPWDSRMQALVASRAKCSRGISWGASLKTGVQDVKNTRALDIRKSSPLGDTGTVDHGRGRAQVQHAPASLSKAEGKCRDAARLPLLVRQGRAQG